jgi:hypothetical protein
MIQGVVLRFQQRAADERERAVSAEDQRLSLLHTDKADKYEAVAAAYLRLVRGAA